MKEPKGEKKKKRFFLVKINKLSTTTPIKALKSNVGVCNLRAKNTKKTKSAKRKDKKIK